MANKNGELVRAEVNRAEEEAQEKKPRTHLGASVMGKKCLRQVWYSWRWARLGGSHTGRILRLFRRGHREEAEVVAGLRKAGFDVQDHSERLIWNQDADEYFTAPWEWSEDEWRLPGGISCLDVSADPFHIQRATERGQGPSQWMLSDHGGHFGGSGDGRIKARRSVFNDDNDRLLEIKTHNAKSFADLIAKGVIKSKPEHHSQMQIYMHYFGLKKAIYYAVNKDTDETYVEEVSYRPEMAALLVDRARDIIFALRPPPRVSDDPSWFICKFCDYREICHYDAPADLNCRSCVFARPVEDKQWKCERFNAILPPDFMPKGCEHWDPIA